MSETNEQENREQPARTTPENRILPMIALRGLVVFPSASVHFDIGREKSIAAVTLAAETDSLVLLAPQKNAVISDPSAVDILPVGTVARIKQVVKLPGENTRILVQGMYRAQIERYVETEERFLVEVSPLEIKQGDPETCEAVKRNILETLRAFKNIDNRITDDVILAVEGEEDYNALCDGVAAGLIVKDKDKQTVLREGDTVKRLEFIAKTLANEVEIGKIERRISSKVKKSIDSNQKEYFLREQMKAISDELGDGTDEVAEWTQKVQKLGIPDKDSEEKVLKEISRMSRMQPSSPEAAVLRNYVECVTELPWSVTTVDNEDLTRAREILDEDHYGLEKVKDRIVEYLAVCSLTKSIKGPILCFAGPPGVGKTSIVRSIARALGRNYVRMSLGGVRDEAEIRGHRKTYIGAIPGRILYHMKQAKSINPVFLLDEIDKMSSDFRGDPASAMLEVLDPEQNNTFRDHYLEIPYDLSKVMFITTANNVESIPAPLLDRMEVINLTGYTEDEKVEIAKRHLIKKQERENGLSEDFLDYPDDVLRETISGYTRESGVRNLEREIGSVCRKVAKMVVDSKGELKKYEVCSEHLSELLGVPKFLNDVASRKNEVGAATGLAWTSVGGTTLTIEVSLMKGKGEILLTGSLGDVMKESARTAISLIRANAEKYRIDSEVFSKNDIHIHVPEGATPKDGPSAGITIATAILSAVTKRPVRCDVAMTGEITLRGKVLPIGGLKEKSLAAHRVGIRTVIIPKENERDIAEFPEKIRREVTFVPAEEIDTAFDTALEPSAKAKK